MSELLHLAARLDESPFDLELRADYAAACQEAGQYTAALKQWQLVLGQSKSARAHLGAAISLLALDRQEEAKQEATLAESHADHEEHWKDLDQAQQDSLRSAKPAPRLRAISGGVAPKEGRVISIHRAETVRFADIVGMEALKKTLRLRIIEPFLRPGLFEKFKRAAGGGVMLYGPPGCGKTLIARAIATECNASFSAIGISDVLTMWIGESEKNLASIFEKARQEAPAVLFFDELDALAFSRSRAQSDHTRTMVNEFLSQLDGVNRRNHGLLILGATNLPWDVDSAMKRPGRFDRQIFVPPPDTRARAALFELKLRDVPTGHLTLSALAEATNGFSGADIDGIIETAKEAALLRELDGDARSVIEQADLVAAVEDATASTLDWLKTARNLVKFGGAGPTYKEVEKYLRQANLY